ncbi:MAG: 3D domain-containing protein [Acidobacteriota bacterium]|nr:3D domain-containing protein [Acidobacteriota bacterium]MDQ3421367.1 3D domain-containing protein [Acidobacteriota bacterium]
MILSRSTGRKVLATAVAAICFAFLFDATVFDSRTVARLAELRQSVSKPDVGSRLRFTATAYCKGTTTASGVAVKNGMAAADPDLLPIGSVIRIESLGDKYDGIYTVMDTGPKVRGRHVDVYLWSCHEALQVRRRKMHLTVLRLGWNPQNSGPLRRPTSNAQLPSSNSQPR